MFRPASRGRRAYRPVVFQWTRPKASQSRRVRRGGLCGCGSDGFAWRSSSKSSDSQSVNGIVFSVRADKLHERNLPAEVECSDQPVTSPSDFEANPITIEHLRFRSCATNVVHRSPIRGLDQPIPPLKRNRRFRMHATVVQEDLSCNYPHARFIALFPPWEQEEISRESSKMPKASR